MVNGTLVWYYYICKRQVWLMGHSIEPEKENPLLAYGRTLTEIVFSRYRVRERNVDNRIKLDIVKNSVVMEIKKSSRYERASYMQLAFYLYYLEKYKGIRTEGVLVFPEERKRIKVRLDDDLRKEIERAIEEVKEIIRSPIPPAPQKVRYCSKCAFRHLCWS